MFRCDEDEHNRNMAGMLERPREKGVTLKLSKSTISAAEVKWFGRVYSVAGMSANPDKIYHIVRAGQPETIEDVRSLLQAARYNAKYGFNHHETKTYEEVTAHSGSCWSRTLPTCGMKAVRTASRPCSG